jgi:hypothetical protein
VCSLSFKKERKDMARKKAKRPRAQVKAERRRKEEAARRLRMERAAKWNSAMEKLRAFAQKLSPEDRKEYLTALASL